MKATVQTLSTMMLMLSALVSSPSAHAARAPDSLLGEWVLNNERSHEIQPKQGGGFGGFGATPSISIGGLPIPLPGAGAAPSDTGASDPQVLRCATMTIAMREASVYLVYQGAGEEVMKAGNDKGRKTSWNRAKLTQSYETNSRKVSKTFEAQDDGSLLVRVKLNPKQGKSVTHARVFERAASPAASD